MEGKEKTGCGAIRASAFYMLRKVCLKLILATRRTRQKMNQWQTVHLESQGKYISAIHHAIFPLAFPTLAVHLRSCIIAPYTSTRELMCRRKIARANFLLSRIFDASSEQIYRMFAVLSLTKQFPSIRCYRVQQKPTLKVLR